MFNGYITKIAIDTPNTNKKDECQLETIPGLFLSVLGGFNFQLLVLGRYDVKTLAIR